MFVAIAHTTGRPVNDLAEEGGEVALGITDMTMQQYPGY